jgi:YesN/AraC family two-component response regulator
MTTILFVDDEADILSSIRRAFYGLDRSWNVQYANSADEAWAIAAEHEIDVVVSDMRMADVDGAELLSALRLGLPNTIRFVLSGYSDEYASVRGAISAHQFFSKPCDFAQLHQTIKHVLALRDALGDVSIARAIDATTSLPSTTDTATRIFEAFQREQLDIPELAHIAKQDVAFALQSLHTGSSAFFGPVVQQANLEACFWRVGESGLRQFVAMPEYLSTAEEFGDLYVEFVNQANAHAYEMANRCAERGEANSEAAYLAGLLHNCGGLLLTQIGRAPLETTCGWCDGDELARVATRYLLALYGVPTDVSVALDSADLSTDLTARSATDSM